jgi:MoaA/NifB/PqqE/SkfB family radical SAM enzyme
MRTTDARWLQVENTSKCNAWCTACGRNNSGFGLREGLVEEDLTIERFTEVLDMLPNLEAIQFCGTFGDPAASTLSMKHFELACDRVNKINIHTNGSLRGPDWWKKVAELLTSSVTEHEVYFALDGLEDTHSIYRQGTSWKKIIENATAFIDAGGNAIWQMIPFAHNEHQIMDCIKLSQQLGFAKFKFVKNVRYPDQSKHYLTGQTIEILPWSRDKMMSKYEQNNRTVTANDCGHLTNQSLYLDASGKVSNCCFFNDYRMFDSFDELPDIEAELARSPDRQCLYSCGTTKNL